MLETLEKNVTDFGRCIFVAVIVLLGLRRLLSWTRLIPKGTTGYFACIQSLPSVPSDVGLSLPPGPSGKPIIGNLLDLPTQQEWVGFSQLAKRYGMPCHFKTNLLRLLMLRDIGDLVYLNIFGQSIVVINSPMVASELFEKRSSIYSDRSEFPMLNDLYVGQAARESADIYR